MLTYIIIAVGIIAVIAVAIFTIKRNNAIQKDGIEADAVVFRVEETENRDDDGHVDTTYTYYVQYQTQDGKTIEARLGNEPAHIFVGSKLRIKYLPAKPKYVIPAK